MNVFICYPKCSTCRKAEAWLRNNGVDFTVRDIKLDHPSADEIRKWQKRSGVPVKRFFNTSGLLYKELRLKERLPEMSEEEQVELLGSDGMLVRRPILVSIDTVLVGFREEEWAKALT